MKNYLEKSIIILFFRHYYVKTGYCYTVKGTEVLTNEVQNYLTSLVSNTKQCDKIEHGFIPMTNTCEIKTDRTSVFINNIMNNCTSLPLLPHFTKNKLKAINMIYNEIIFLIKYNFTNFESEISNLDYKLKQLLQAENNTSIDTLYISNPIVIENKMKFDALSFSVGTLVGLVVILIIILYNIIIIVLRCVLVK